MKKLLRKRWGNDYQIDENGEHAGLQKLRAIDIASLKKRSTKKIQIQGWNMETFDLKIE